MFEKEIDVKTHLKSLNDNSVTSLTSALQTLKIDQSNDVIDFIVTEEEDKHYNTVSVLFENKKWEHYMI